MFSSRFFWKIFIGFSTVILFRRCSRSSLSLSLRSHSSLSALVDKDTTMARDVLKMDDEVDDMNRQMYIALEKVMMDNPSAVKRATHMLSSSRHLERIADLATNIAEDVVFMVDGELIRHRTGDYLESTTE